MNEREPQTISPCVGCTNTDYCADNGECPTTGDAYAQLYIDLANLGQPED